MAQNCDIPLIHSAVLDRIGHLSDKELQDLDQEIDNYQQKLLEMLLVRKVAQLARGQQPSPCLPTPTQVAQIQDYSAQNLPASDDPSKSEERLLDEIRNLPDDELNPATNGDPLASVADILESPGTKGGRARRKTYQNAPRKLPISRPETVSTLTGEEHKASKGRPWHKAGEEDDSPPPPPSPDSSPTRLRIAKYLHTNGPKKQCDLLSELDIARGSAGFYLNHPWFSKDDGRVSITPVGIAQAIHKDSHD